MRELIERLTFVERHKVAIALYKSDWKGAVAECPEPLQDDMRRLCDEHSLRDLALAFDPASEGIRVEINARDFF